MLKISTAFGSKSDFRKIDLKKNHVRFVKSCPKIVENIDMTR